MSETTTLNIRVNKDLKKQSEAILSLLGLALSQQMVDFDEK